MLITLPSLGGDEGIWDDGVNAALSLIDAHDHTTNKGARIRAAAINIDGDLAYNGFFLNTVGKIVFSSIAVPSTDNKSIFVSTVDNELYWRTNAGTNVKLTSGTSINTSLVGGILGDYSTVGAEVAYDDVNDRYTFKQQGSKPWARIASGPVRIYEFNTTEALYVELAAPSTLASSYTVTLPLVPPGTQAMLQMSTAGVLLASNTIAQALTATDFKHSSPRTHKIPAMMMTNRTVHVKTVSAAGAHVGWGLAANSERINIPVQLHDGDVITGYSILINKITNAATTISGRMHRTLIGGGTIGTETNLGAGSSNAANAPGAIVLGEVLNITVDNSNTYYITCGNACVAAAADVIYSAEVYYTRS